MASFALIYQVLGGLMALFFGSLTGVLIKRIPENKKLVLARSECPKCGHQLKWYENIPLLSFLILRAKCSNCKTKIPFFYPLIELGFLLCALPFINLAAKRLANFTGPFDQALIFIDLLFYFAFIAIALAAGLIDQGKKILPHKLSFAGILLGIMYVSLFASPYYEFSATLEELTSGILASTLSVIKQFAIVVFSLDLAVYFINKLVFRKDALLEVSNALCLGIGKLQEQKNLVYMLYSILVLILIYLNQSFVLELFFIVLGFLYLALEIIPFYFVKNNLEINEQSNTKKTVLGGGDIMLLGFFATLLGFKKTFLLMFAAFYVAFIFLLFKIIYSYFKYQIELRKNPANEDNSFDIKEVLRGTIPLGLALAVTFIAVMMTLAG